MAMTIRLSDHQERQLLDWAGKITAAEVAGDCEPSGYDLIIGVSAHGSTVEARSGSLVLDLGECELVLGNSG